MLLHILEQQTLDCFQKETTTHKETQSSSVAVFFVYKHNPGFLKDFQRRIPNHNIRYTAIYFVLEACNKPHIHKERAKRGHHICVLVPLQHHY